MCNLLIFIMSDNKTMMMFHGEGPAPRQTPTAEAGCAGDTGRVTTATSWTPVIATDSAPANNINRQSSVSDVSRDRVDQAQPSTSSPPHGTSNSSTSAEHDFTPARDDNAPSSSTSTTAKLHEYFSGNLSKGSVIS